MVRGGENVSVAGGGGGGMVEGPRGGARKLCSGRGSPLCSLNLRGKPLRNVGDAVPPKIN